MVKLRVNAASASNSCSNSAFSASMKDSVMFGANDGNPVGAPEDDDMMNEKDNALADKGYYSCILQSIALCRFPSFSDTFMLSYITGGALLRVET